MTNPPLLVRGTVLALVSVAALQPTQSCFHPQQPQRPHKAFVPRHQAKLKHAGPTTTSTSLASSMDPDAGVSFSDSVTTTISSTTTSSSSSSTFPSLASWSQVFPAALLVTGNTFGAGCLVLPDLAPQAGGFLPLAGLFLGAYLANLVSGFVLAEVAIQQKEQATNNNDSESSSSIVPSSFQEFVQENLQSKTAANLVSLISIGVNACVFSFDLSRIGEIIVQQQQMVVPEYAGSILWAMFVLTLMTTQTNRSLSQIASCCATVLFLSFGSLLLPGLQAVQDPLGTIFHTEVFSSTTTTSVQVGPVVLMAMVYQNIVPSITKLMNYDRTQTRTALALGSFLPLLMYLAWVYACVGGGIDYNNNNSNNSLGAMTVFSLATLAGSGIGSGMSLSEEMEQLIYQKPPPTPTPNTILKEDSTSTGETTRYDFVASLLSVGLPLAAVLALSGEHDMTEALSLAGGVGSPLLYGVLPAWMAWKQQQQKREPQSVLREATHPSKPRMRSSPPSSFPLLLSSPSLSCLGILSSGLMGEEIFQYVHNIITI